MNLPSGIALKTNLDVAAVDFAALLAELEKRKFNGYACLCSAGNSGFEEGTLVFDDGKPVASIYEYYAFKKTFFGEQAFKRIANASCAATGVLDLFELSNEQVRLVLAFNERAIHVPDVKAIFSQKMVFSAALEEEAKSSMLPATKSELLKKYGLVDAGKAPAAAQSLQSPVEEEDLLKPLSK